MIAPYEHTLNAIDIVARQTWATGVLDTLAPLLNGHRRVVFFAGMKYREFLVEPLEGRGVKVEVPVSNLGIGEQLAWLTDRQ